jgi:hypothetical protein
MVWEIVFMLLILKIPIVYVCVVTWWAIKSEPTPPDHAEVTVVADTPSSGGSGQGGSAPRRRSGHRRPVRPHAPGLGGGSAAPTRGPARTRGDVRP